MHAPRHLHGFQAFTSRLKMPQETQSGPLAPKFPLGQGDFRYDLTRARTARAFRKAFARARGMRRGLSLKTLRAGVA
jgi:hypothetical protein